MPNKQEKMVNELLDALSPFAYFCQWMKAARTMKEVKFKVKNPALLSLTGGGGELPCRVG